MGLFRIGPRVSVLQRLTVELKKLKGIVPDWWFSLKNFDESTDKYIGGNQMVLSSKEMEQKRRQHNESVRKEYKLVSNSPQSNGSSVVNSNTTGAKVLPFIRKSK